MSAAGPAALPFTPDVSSSQGPEAPFGPLSPTDLAALLSGLVQLGADGIMAVDAEQRVLLFNHGAEEIFGYRADEVLGRSLNLLIPARYHAQHAAEHLPAFARGHATARRMAERTEVWAVRKSGEEFPAEVAIGRVQVGGRTVYTAVIRDATERVRYEAELRERGDALARAARARDEVLAIVSHDLRNPLSTVSMCARALSGAAAEAAGDGAVGGGVDAERVRALADTVERAAGWAQGIIRDLLDAARLEAGGFVLYPEAVPVGAVLDALRELHAAQAAEAGVALEVAAPPAGLPPLWADVDRLVQALGNLVGNALKFTAAGGRVHVDAAPAALRGRPAVTVAVRDTGRGIPEEHLPHLFDRFWQARETRRGGAGLGLAIARGIVVQHGGEVAVESAVGRGTTFVVTLPAADVGDDGASGG